MSDSFSRNKYNYDLPNDLVAAEPLSARESARLLVVNRKSRTLEHRLIQDLPEILDSSFSIVANNTKVFRARLFGNRVGTDAKVEFFMLKQVGPLRWQGLMKTGPRVTPGFEFKVSDILVKVIDREETNAGVIITAEFSEDPLSKNVGEVPRPPYIVAKRLELAAAGSTPAVKNPNELEVYNTTYAKESGSVAAPTAGRHFTADLIQKLTKKGISWSEVTLHVGLGTFKPVMVDDIREHRMHAESATISPVVAQQLNADKKAGKKILAVGTTSTRTLESFYDPKSGLLKSGTQETEIFIYPESGHSWSMVDAMLTNFHFPESTLLMMVSSFVGDTDWVLEIYREAVKQKYRFYSYGDAMLII